MLRQLLATTAVAVALTGATWAQEADDTTEPIIVEPAAPAAEPMSDSHDGEVPLAEEGAAAQEAIEGEATIVDEAPVVEDDAATTAEGEAPAGEVPLVEEGDTTTAQEAPVVEGDTVAQEPVDPAAAIEAELVPVDIAALTVEDLIGASLRSPGGETLGAIDDALLDEGGNIESLVISFGGFLGFGKKTVEVALDEVELMKNGGGTIVARTAMTPESLEALPDYEELPET